MVYVLNIEGKPLMPCKEAKARHLLRDGKAIVVRKEPFTIRLLFEVDNATQEVALGIDAGSKHIGVSATTDKKELYAADVELRNDIVDLLSSRREMRKTRRSRLRYRQARFNNRVHSKNKGWLAPSVEQKINCHLKVVEDVHKILPVSKVIVEVASFDIQKIKNPNIEGKEYQQGEQLGFWNVREYVLFRDGHTCQCCKGKSKDSILNVHHIESRKTGGNSPNNLITLCETCHTGYHKGTVKLPKNIKRGMSFKDASFMGIMRWAFYERLKAIYTDVSMTYGYITKNTRIKNNLPKDHYIDARCISANPLAEPLGYVWYIKKVRRHNRQIHKAKILKGGVKKMNQAPYEVLGYRLFDKIKIGNEIGFISGRRQRGTFKLIRFDGSVIGTDVNCNKITLIAKRGSYIRHFLPTAEAGGTRAVQI